MPSSPSRNSARPGVTRLIGTIIAFTGTLSSAPRFVPAAACAFCHSRPGILTEGPAGHYATWRFSIMSGAARDPYWRARVKAEAAASPEGRAEVEDKCLRCHAAADHYEFRSRDRSMRMTDLTETGTEGVTCTVCHRIDAAGLGTSISFSGGFRIHPDAVLFGPHEAPFAMPMLHHTGYEPVAGRQLLEAALCGNCHTVLLAGASGARTFPEQTTYLEWLASDRPALHLTCQTCHVPLIRHDDGTAASDYIAHRPPGGAFPPTWPRTPIGIHTFVGGNVQMLKLFSNSAGGSGFEERASAAAALLTSALSLNASTRLERGDVIVDVTVHNRTGHKLPTGLPGRRLWLHVTATDAAGQTVFESGAWVATTGELRYASSYEPHRNTVDRPDQAAIYEAVLENARGRQTTLFTQAARYRKDNRLLPPGFNPASRMPEGIPPAWAGPVGTEADADFVAGRDTVHYRIPRTGKAPLRVSIEACFQSIAPAEASLVPMLPRNPAILASAVVSVQAP